MQAAEERRGFSVALLGVRRSLLFCLSELKTSISSMTMMFAAEIRPPVGTFF
jgi:hypothetical protein